MYDAIFWDNDGVLMATEHLYFEANVRALAEIGVTLTLDAYREHSLHRGESVLQLAGALQSEELRLHRDLIYAELLDTRSQRIPGIHPVLQCLHGRQPMAVVTSCRRPNFERMHRNSRLLGFFDFILTREDYTAGKPDPEPYLTACRKAGVAPERCLAVEDSPRGVKAAATAGLTVAALPGEMNAGGDFCAARWQLDTISQLPGLLGLASPPNQHQGEKR